MWRYGLELEGFWCPTYGAEPIIPPVGAPTDGFPGLIEARTVGGKDLPSAYLELLGRTWEIERNFTGGVVDYTRYEWTFKPEERRELRKRPWDKAPCDVRNLYGKKPRDLGRKAIASLQINISDLRSEGRTHNVYHDGKPATAVPIPAVYGQLDIPKIVKRLDEAFADDIKASNRQMGEYCIKDGTRLEYRSLPNGCFNYTQANDFFKKVKDAVERE